MKLSLNIDAPQNGQCYLPGEAVHGYVRLDEYTKECERLAEIYVAFQGNDSFNHGLIQLTFLDGINKLSFMPRTSIETVAQFPEPRVKRKTTVVCVIWCLRCVRVSSGTVVQSNGKGTL